jgi:hypothetical protein
MRISANRFIADVCVMGDIGRVVPANVILKKDGFKQRTISHSALKIEGVRWHLEHRKRVNNLGHGY